MSQLIKSDLIKVDQIRSIQDRIKDCGLIIINKEIREIKLYPNKPIFIDYEFRIFNSKDFKILEGLDPFEAKNLIENEGFELGKAQHLLSLSKDIRNSLDFPIVALDSIFSIRNIDRVMILKESGLDLNILCRNKKFYPDVNFLAVKKVLKLPYK